MEDKVMNAQTRQALDHLVNAVNVSINYKDKLFLNVLVGKKISSLNKLTTKNDKNKTIFAEDVTFDDVKFAFESNNLQKELEETEQKYIDSKTINGLYADDRFVEGFDLRGIDIVGEIYQAFDNLTGEILRTEKMVQKRIKSSSDYAEKTVSSYIPSNLVFEVRDKKKAKHRHKIEDFQFINLMPLLG